ncbi:pyridoxamine 5'-phosphate oxidase family protein [Alkaliphilus sp. MSJ-5]|uniref:Pyridoxamine 5'-phosphate oxidase family protein n=1 Tax=Alkaliphilus flagellatus TaxID=2841507 RepID=A0ABS6G6M8_9FIRM|nr:pyridoxamine 5'-phosphate oxidase family protein [Alkaliphilus flagellatus]MBU5677085.1 pyridoxamine 5'-phosphate oxidase family protein [Alkaliphilus flagellatus]
MFKEMRRKDKEITKDEIEEILTKGEYGILSTINDNGYPYTVPLSFVYYNNSIYFHCAIEGQKLDNIRQNDKVSFCVVTDTEVLAKKFTTKYKSVVVFGVASETDDDLKEGILFELANKYSPQFLVEGKKYIQSAKDKTKVIKIDINHITGKAGK